MKEISLITSLVNFSNELNNILLRRIHLRINMLMKLIFVETKKHNLKYVCKLQNYLVNSSEAKILMLRISILEIYHAHYKNIKDTLIYININSKKIISNLYQSSHYYSNKKIEEDTIKKYLKYNLAYMCIRPVWQARSVKNIHKQLNNKSEYNEYSFFFISDYLKKSLKPYIDINQSIKYLLQDLVCINNPFTQNIMYRDYFKSFRRTPLISYKTQNYLIINLIYCIFLDNLNWYLFNNLKKEDLLKYVYHCNIINCRQREMNILIKEVVYSLRYNLIQKQKSIENYIFRLCNNFYSKTQLDTNAKESNRLNFYVNQILNSILRKRLNRFLKKKTIYYSIRTKNSVLNKLIYICNLNTSYKI